MKRICVYCGSKPGNKSAYLKAARSLGKAMCEQGIGLVYGGASVGLMGQIADTVLKNGGDVIGVIPNGVFKNEMAHNGLTELITVDNMHQRKETMSNLADGFVALPGGFGTLEELFEAITWSQIKIHNKPVGLFNESGYYDRLHDFISHSVAEGFIKAKHQELYAIHENPVALLEAMVRKSYTG